MFSGMMFEISNINFLILFFILIIIVGYSLIMKSLNKNCKSVNCNLIK